MQGRSPALSSQPKSASLRSGRASWTDRRKVPGYNLFYLDLETDALARVLGLDRALSLASS